MKVGTSGDIRFSAAKKSNGIFQYSHSSPPLRMRTSVQSSLHALEIQGRADVNMFNEAAVSNPETVRPQMSDEEFANLKKEFEEKLKQLSSNVRHEAEYWMLNKFNINTALEIISRELYLNRNILNNAGTMLYLIQSPLQAETAGIFLSNEEHGNNAELMESAGRIIKMADTPEKAGIINKILSDKKIYGSKLFKERTADRIDSLMYNLKFPEQLKAADKIFFDERFINDENLLEKAYWKICFFDTPEKAEELLKILDDKELQLKNIFWELYKDTEDTAQFSYLYKKHNISEITRSEKRDFIHNLVSLKDESLEKLSGMFSLIPKNRKEYCRMLPAVVKSLTVETKPLSDTEISEFNKDIEKTAETLKYIPDYEFTQLDIKQEYSKNKFISDVLEKIKDLSFDEKQKVYDYFGFELYQNKRTQTGRSLSGYPVNIENSGKYMQITDKKTKDVIKDLRKNVIKFTENNKIICKNKKLETDLNNIIKVLPELRPSIGNIQHGTHMYDIFTHSLKVMQGIVKNPEFDKLNASDKKIMLLAALFHDVTKKECSADGHHADNSSFDASFIVKKLKLTYGERLKFYTLIKNHEWLKHVNSTSVKTQEELKKRRHSAAYAFRNDNIFEMSLIFTDADIKAVNNYFYDNKTVDFNGTARSRGKAAEYHGSKIKEYIGELKKTQPLLPVTPFPKADRINQAVTNINPDGSTNIRGVYKDKDGLIVIKYNELRNEDLEKTGFSKGCTVSGTKTRTEQNEDVNTGNIKFFVHGLDYPEHLINFDVFSLFDSKALLSASYAERPESKYRFFRPQGVILNCAAECVHGGGETDSGSGDKKHIEDFINRSVFFKDDKQAAKDEDYYPSVKSEKNRTYISDLIKQALNLNDEEYIKFVQENKNKPMSEIGDAETREKIIKAFSGINSNNRNGNRQYNEMYISNPLPPMAVFAYSIDEKEKVNNPLDFLNKTNITDEERRLLKAWNCPEYPLKERIAFLRKYALERNIPFVVFGD